MPCVCCTGHRRRRRRRRRTRPPSSVSMPRAPSAAPRSLSELSPPPATHTLVSEHTSSFESLLQTFSRGMVVDGGETRQANTKGKKKKGGQEEKREGRCRRFTLGSAPQRAAKDAEAPSRTRRRAGLVDDREAHVARGALDHAHRRLDLDRVGVGQLLLRDLLDLRARHLADLLGVGLAAARRDACF